MATVLLLLLLGLGFARSAAGESLLLLLPSLILSLPFSHKGGLSDRQKVVGAVNYAQIELILPGQIYVISTSVAISKSWFFFFAFWLCNNFAGPENNYFCGFLNLNIILLWSDFLPKTSFSLFANLLNWISLNLLHSWTDFCICPFVFVWLIKCLIQVNSVIFFCL